MISTAGLMALWMVAATPAGAVFDTDASLDKADRAIHHYNVSSRGDRAGETRNAPQPAPRKLPYDPAYDTVAAPQPSNEGIPGLPPVEETPKTPPPPPPPPPEKPVEPGKVDISDESSGEAFCDDLDVCDPAVCRGQGGRGGWFDGVFWEGWLDQGVTINTLSPRNRINGPVTFNDRSNDYQLNQFYSRLFRDVDVDGCAWDVGGRVDLLYGTDSFFVASRGLEVRDDLSPKWNAQRYGLAMPQCYMEVYSPWGNGLSMKLGHFYSILGYERVEAPENFFYSHSYLRQYAEPYTHTGLLGETKLGDFAVLAGMTRGDDNWDDNNNDFGFTGGIKWANCTQRTKIALCVDAAREQPDPSTDIRTVYSLVVQQNLGESWDCVVQFDYGNEPRAGIDRTDANWYGLDSYLFYTINDCWKVGARFEWFRDEGGARVTDANRTADYFNFSPGINWTPSDRLIVRSELRWDGTTTKGHYPFGDGTHANQLLLDCDVIVRF